MGSVTKLFRNKTNTCDLFTIFEHLAINFYQLSCREVSVVHFSTSKINALEFSSHVMYRYGLTDYPLLPEASHFSSGVFQR
jgi:hypothetical protein